MIKTCCFGDRVLFGCILQEKPLLLTFSFNAYLTTSVCTTSLCDNADQNLFVLEIVAIDFADLLFWWQYAKFEIKLFYYKHNSLMLYVLKGKLISCLDKIAIGKF